MPVHFLELAAGYQPHKALKTMHNLLKPMKNATLEAMGCAGEAGDVLEVPEGGKWMLMQSIRAAWELLKSTLPAAPGTMEEVQLVDAERVQTIFDLHDNLEKGEVSDAEDMVIYVATEW